MLIVFVIREDMVDLPPLPRLIVSRFYGEMSQRASLTPLDTLCEMLEHAISSYVYAGSNSNN